MKEKEQQHPLKGIKWGLMGIAVYRGTIVERYLVGYFCFNKKVKTEQEVDELIDNAAKSIYGSLNS